MDTLDCRSPAACRTCEHALASGACKLEADIDVALAAWSRRAPAAPRARASPRRAPIPVALAPRASA